MMAERVYFFLCSALGWSLRSARYSKVRFVHREGHRQVRKYRVFYAPLLVGLGAGLMRMLNTGVRILPQRDWEARERLVYWRLHGTSIRVDADGTLVLPCLPGETLAAVLHDPELNESVRKEAIEMAVGALAGFHRLGLTHGDAMAENVLVDLEAGVAHWFDFESVHDRRRPVDWQRADDVRALLVTCLLRTGPERVAETLELILDVYEDSSRRSCDAAKAEEVTRLLATSFNSVWRRPLAFHLGQAGLSFQCFREIARLLKERSPESQRILIPRENSRQPRGVIRIDGRAQRSHRRTKS